MVGYQPEQRLLSQSEYAAAGALSGVFTRAVIQPLDVVKIRFQLQVEPIARGGQSKYYGILQAFKCILREEGASALWKGHVPAQILSVVFGVAQFVSFEVLTAVVGMSLPLEYSTKYRPLTHYVCGGAAGCVASVASHPFDVIRTRLVAQGTTKVYTSLSGAAQTMVREEGVRALYRGLGPTLLAIGPQAGFQFAFYTLFTDTWKFFAKRHAGDKFDGSMESIVCGSGAGLCAKLAVYPLDLTKKRLEIQGFAHGRSDMGQTDSYRGLLHCMRKVSQKEGLAALYKGLAPSLLKAAVSSACIFYSYEQCCKIMYRTHSR